MKTTNLSKSLMLAVMILLLISCKKKPENDLPVVETTSASDISQSGATVGGSVTVNGNARVTEFGIFWSTTNNSPGRSDTKIEGTGSPDNFSLTLSGLNPGTDYYYKAYAVNSEGTGTGSARSFTTLPGTNPLPPQHGQKACQLTASYLAAT